MRERVSMSEGTIYNWKTNKEENDMKMKDVDDRQLPLQQIYTSRVLRKQQLLQHLYNFNFFSLIFFGCYTTVFVIVLCISVVVIVVEQLYRKGINKFNLQKFQLSELKASENNLLQLLCSCYILWILYPYWDCEDSLLDGYNWVSVYRGSSSGGGRFEVVVFFYCFYIV